MPITTWKPDGESPADATTTWDLIGSHPLFTRSFTIPFAALVGMKHVVNVDGTQLSGSFIPWDYDVQDAGAPESLQVADKGTALYCVLPAPRQIRKIVLSHADASASGHKVKLYRLDGDTMADSPTIEVNNNAMIAGDFVAARFAVTLEDSSDTRKNLSASHLSECTVRSLPTSPRLQLVPPEGVDGSAIPLWQQPGQPEGAGRDFTLTDVLAEACNTIFNSIDPTGPVQPRIVIAADAPAKVTVSTFSVAAASQLLDLPWDEKRRFVFSGRGAEIFEVPLNVSPESIVADASCESVERFSAPSTPLDSSSAMPPQPTATGIRIGLHESVDQPVQLADAYEMTALWCGITALTSGTMLTGSIVESRNDRILAVSETTFKRSGWQGGVRLRFEPVVLPSGSYSIRITCDRGALLWHTSPGTPAPVSGAGQRYDGQKAVYSLERTIQNAEFTVTNSIASLSDQPFRIEISGTPVPSGIIGDNGRRAHNFAAALSGTLAAAKPPVLRLSSRQKGEVTFYPLSIRFT